MRENGDKPDNGRSAEREIDAFIDGTMDERERAAFELKLETDRELRREVDCQRLLDDSLARLYAAPSADRVVSRVQAASSGGSAAPVRSSLVRRGLSIAAVIAILCFAGWRTWSQLYPPLTKNDLRYRFRGLETVYQDELRFGFEPQWVCETDEEFRETFEKRLGQGLLMARAPVGTVSLGLSYGYSISEETVYLLARVGGRDVIVFVDRVQADSDQRLRAEGELKLFSRRVGDLVLYEVTPLSEPALLDLFHEP